MVEHSKIETSPSQYEIKDRTKVFKPQRMYLLWYQMKVQNVYNTPLNVQTPNLQITNSSLMSNN